MLYENNGGGDHYMMNYNDVIKLLNELEQAIFSHEDYLADCGDENGYSDHSFAYINPDSIREEFKGLRDALDIKSVNYFNWRNEII